MRALLLPALLMAVVPAVAQTAPAKGVNTISASVPDAPDVVYKHVAQSLLAAGYSLDKADKELGFIATKPRPAPRYNMLYACMVSIQAAGVGSVATISGTFSLPGAAAVSPLMAGETAIEYRGGANSTFMICWQQMQKALHDAYPEAPLTYTRK